MSLPPARQERGFERLCRRHVADVYRYALVVLDDPEAAESATQATFVNALRAHQRGERPRRPFNWLLAIAHSVCARHASGDEARLEAWDEDELPSPADIRRALDRLGFDERSALMLRELECRSYAEITEVLELRDVEVETLIFRARQALREQLERSLACHQAERAVSRGLDGQLSHADRNVLRAHLRSCPDCSRFRRLQLESRVALRSVGAVPVPHSLRAGLPVRAALGAEMIGS